MPSPFERATIRIYADNVCALGITSGGYVTRRGPYCRVLKIGAAILVLALIFRL